MSISKVCKHRQRGCVKQARPKISRCWPFILAWGVMTFRDDWIQRLPWVQRRVLQPLLRSGSFFLTILHMLHQSQYHRDIDPNSASGWTKKFRALMFFRFGSRVLIWSAHLDSLFVFLLLLVNALLGVLRSYALQKITCPVTLGADRTAHLLLQSKWLIFVTPIACRP